MNRSSNSELCVISLHLLNYRCSSYWALFSGGQGSLLLLLYYIPSSVIGSIRILGSMLIRPHVTITRSTLIPLVPELWAASSVIDEPIANLCHADPRCLRNVSEESHVV